MAIKLPIYDTVDEHRKKQEEPAKVKLPVFTSVEKYRQQQEEERKRKIAALLSSSKAPAGMKVSNYLAYLAQNGGMDASTKAAYDAEMEAKAADPKKQSQLAGAIAIQKERELADYMASDERKQKAPVATAVKTDSPMGDLGAFLGQSLFNKLQTGSFTGDEKEGTLRAQKDYFQNLSGSLLAQDTMEKDMQILSTWSPQDKEDLETYLNHSDLAYGRTDVIGSAALDRLNKKFGRDLVAQVAESYSQHLNDQTAAEAEKLGKENHGLLDVAASIPLGWLGSITSTASQARQTVKDTLGLTTGRYKTNDTNTPGDLLSIYTGAVQQGAAEEAGEWGKAVAEAHGASKQVQEFAGKAASTAVQVGIGAADNLARVALTGGVGSLALAATGSFSSAMREASQKGASPQQALAMGFVSAASEVLTEKLPLDNLLANVGKGANLSNIGKLVTEAAKQAGIELATEEVNLMAGLIAEAGILREKSGYRQTIADAVAGGMSYAEAAKQANRELLQQAGQTALQAGLSGFLTSGASSVISGTDASGRLPQVADTYEQQKEGASSLVGDLLSRLPIRKDTQTQAAKQDTPAADVVEEILNKHDTQQAPPTDPIQELLKLAAQGKPVTNKQATGILNNPEAVQKLTQETGLDLDALTASQKRNAVKDVIARLVHGQETDASAEAEKMNQLNIDNTNAAEYNNTITGGERNDRAGSYGEDQAGVSGVYKDSGSDGPGGRELGGVSVGSGLVLLSPASRNLLNQRGVVNVELHESSADNAAFSAALGRARVADPVHGWAVTPKSPEDLDGGNIRTYMNENASTGFAIAPDGDIEAVFANKAAGAPRGSTKVTIPLAIANGGTKLDCYGAGLIRLYSQYGFVPVARCKFDPVYANDGWTPDKGMPDIYFMMHNGDSADAVVANYGNYHIPTKAELDALPVMDYDSAYAYRDQVMQHHPATDGAVGAAEQNFTGRAAYQDLLSDENSQPDRPGDVRPMEVPKVDGYGRKVSGFVPNAYGAKVTPDSFVPVIEELIQEGALGYDTKTNAQSLQEAAAYIKKSGPKEARREITGRISNGKIKDGDIPAAMLLYSKYANMKDADAQEDAAELFVDLQMMATQTGRDLQLFKMLRKLTPQGKLMAVTKNVDRYVQQLNKGRSEAQQAEVAIPKELTDAYVEAAQEAAVTDSPENQQRMDEAEQAIYAYAAGNIKATLREKWDAWRHLAMLGNPKTQIRNVLGNAMFRPFVDVKRYLGTAIEAMVLKPEQRTKAILGTDENSRALIAWAKQDAKTQAVTDRMDYTATTGDSARSQIEDKRQIFRTKALEKARTGLNDLMGAEDMLFKRSAYATSLASFLKARGVTAQQLSDGTVDAATLEAARNYAVEEAMEATFNDRNALSNALVNFRYKGSNPVGKVLNAAAEGILPFRRTPANIVMRAAEYSPIGLAKTITADAVRVAKGKITAAEYIDNLAAGLTGTGAMALGYGLAAGIFEGVRLVGKEDDEDKKRTGHQSYALEIGDTSITMDWAAPAVLPLFMGANLYSALNGDGEEVSTSAFTAFLESCATSLEPMLELSCLSSLNDLATDIRYAPEGKWLYSVAASAATSYLLQGLPTLGGQIEQTFEKEKKTVHTESSDPVVKGLQQVVGRATQKIPGLDLFQAEKVDAWGQTKEKKGAVQSVFDAFLNPAYTSTIRETEADTEITRLNGVQDEKVSPDTPAKKLSYKDKDGKQVSDRILSAEEYTALSKAQGRKQKELVESILGNSAYASLTDAQKAAAIDYAYAYAKDYARGEVLEDHPGITTKWMAQIRGDVAEGILRQVAVGTTGKYTELPIEKASFVDELLSGLWDKPREDKPDGGKYTSVRQIQQIEAIVAADKELTEKQQKLVLQDILDEKAFAKYEKVTALGYDNDDFAEIYRLCLDTEGGKGNTIRALMRQQGISYAAAKQLYEIYSKSKDTK